MTNEQTDTGSTVHGIDDTIRVAMGFILGGFTAVHFDLGYALIVIITLGIVFLEVIYGFGSAWYKAIQTTKQRKSD